MNSFYKLVPRKTSIKKSKKLRNGDTVPFYKDDDAEDGTYKFNLKADFTVDYIEPSNKPKFRGATLEVGNGNFGLSIFF